MDSAPVASTDKLGSLGGACDEQVFNGQQYASRSVFHPRKWRVKAYVKNLWHALTKGPSDNQNTLITRSRTWDAMIRVVYGNNDGHRISALALLDSQCEFDMISTRCAARLGLNYKNAPREHLANTITGNRVYKVGEVWIRWCLEEGVRLSSSDEEITFSRRFEEARFLVVDSELFDVIIGHPTLVSLDLYAQQKNLVAPFRTLASKVSSSASDTAAEQRDFEKRMEKERLRMEEAERRRALGSSHN